MFQQARPPAAVPRLPQPSGPPPSLRSSVSEPGAAVPDPAAQQTVLPNAHGVPLPGGALQLPGGFNPHQLHPAFPGSQPAAAQLVPQHPLPPTAFSLNRMLDKAKSGAYLLPDPAAAEPGTEPGTEPATDGPRVVWARVHQDLVEVCNAVIAQAKLQPATWAVIQREVQKVAAAAKETLERHILKHRQEWEEMVKEKEMKRLMDRIREHNQAPAVQGDWRTTAFPPRTLDQVTQYVPVEGLTAHEEEDVMSQLSTELNGLLSYAYNYDAAPQNTTGKPKKLDDRQIEAEVGAVLEGIIHSVSMGVLGEADLLAKKNKRLGEDIVERSAWGLDSYTRLPPLPSHPTPTHAPQRTQIIVIVPLRFLIVSPQA